MKIPLNKKLMKPSKPTLEEVKEYFKDAEKCKDWKKDKFIFELDKIKETNNGWVQNSFDKNWGVLWLNNKGYAKILTYKKPKFVPIAMKCNQEQFDRIKPKLEILELYKIESFDNCVYLINNFDGKDKIITNVKVDYKSDYNRTVHKTWNEEIFLNACGIETELELETFTVNRTGTEKGDLYVDGIKYVPENKESYTITKDQILKYDMREEFPEVFEVELIVGKWYISSLYIINYQGNDSCYGKMLFSDFRWFDKLPHTEYQHTESNYREATHEEVFEVLKTEAVRRYKVGDYLKNHHGIWKLEKLNLVYSDKYNNGIYNKQGDGKWLFFNGIWAEIIKPKQMTQSEIEKELGYLIEIV